MSNADATPAGPLEGFPIEGADARDGGHGTGEGRDHGTYDRRAHADEGPDTREDDDVADGDVLMEVRSGRVHHTPAHGVQGYDPNDRDSVALAEAVLKARLGSDRAPTLVHEDPSIIARIWRWFVGD